MIEKMFRKIRLYEEIDRIVLKRLLLIWLFLQSFVVEAQVVKGIRIGYEINGCVKQMKEVCFQIKNTSDKTVHGDTLEVTTYEFDTTGRVTAMSQYQREKNNRELKLLHSFTYKYRAGNNNYKYVDCFDKQEKYCTVEQYPDVELFKIFFYNKRGKVKSSGTFGRDSTGTEYFDTYFDKKGSLSDFEIHKYDESNQPVKYDFSKGKETYSFIYNVPIETDRKNWLKATYISNYQGNLLKYSVNRQFVYYP